jgi:hypothetical protein
VHSADKQSCKSDVSDGPHSEVADLIRSPRWRVRARSAVTVKPGALSALRLMANGASLDIVVIKRFMEVYVIEERPTLMFAAVYRGTFETCRSCAS